MRQVYLLSGYRCERVNRAERGVGLQHASAARMVNEVSKFARACVQTRNTRRVQQRQKIFGAVAARGGQLEFRQGKAWELALDHVAQHRIVRLRAGGRIVQFVTEILRGGRQMDQNEADTIDGEVETHFAVDGPPRHPGSV